ncbi:MAG: hypothetical protein EA424_09270 [Planctomycetaceae bacterium]|nr:MAG: hypothetical protein EA424_09270 [Planctomycetaceae bacterium]
MTRPLACTLPFAALSAWTTLFAWSSVVAADVAADVLVIDDFEYADASAAGEQWRIAEDSTPVQVMSRPTPTGTTALKLPCDFSRQRRNDRVVYDRDVDLDLVEYGTIVFDFYAQDPAPVRGGTLYFRSGDGWYGAGFGIQRGWNRIRLGKGAFRSEGSPAGWDRVDRVRIAIWKSRDLDTVCAIDHLHARSESIVVVAGRSGTADAQATRDTAERVGDLLDAAGIPHGIHSSDDVIAGALQGRRLAIFAYSPGMEDQEADQVREFVDAGGRVVFFYSIRRDLADMLGLSDTAYRSRQRPGEFDHVVFDTGSVSGLPERIFQASWNITIARPTDHNARVIGWWQDAKGNRGEPAVIVSDRGAFMGHILTGEDLGAKQDFLLALIGHFEPDAWQYAAHHAVTGAVRVGPFTERAELEAFLQRRAPETPHPGQIRKLWQRAEADAATMMQLLDDQRYQDVITRSAQVRNSLAEAYVLAHRPRDGEFRAVWNHSGTGDLASWDDAMRALSEAGFNAVVPNMWWGGVAHYASDLLPRSATFREKGDQIAQAVEAGKRYGIEVHPWKVNYRLGNTTREFTRQMRQAGRLQRKVNGEVTEWLCPSHPENQQLEIDTMVEVARNYDVDGVHFDYIRYPGEDSCYCDGCRERFEADLGQTVQDWPNDCYRGDLADAFRDWRCEQINTVVRETARQVRAIKPHVKISAAVFSGYPGTKRSIGQDWVHWCREGWLDFVCPMNYTTIDSSFQSMTAGQMGHLQGAVPLVTGIGHWRISDEQAIGQAEISRQSGSDGFILFNMGAVLGQRGLPKFGQAMTSTPASPPHNGPVIRFHSSVDDDQPVSVVPGQAMTLEVSMVGLGEHRRPATAVQGRLQVEDPYGQVLSVLMDLPEVGESVSLTIPRQSGTFRVGAMGELTFDDGSTQRFLVRSRPYRFTE